MRRVLLAWLGLLAASTAHAELPAAGECAGIYWDLTALFEEGDQLYARVLLSRVGPGALSAAGQGHWRDADGIATPFQNGRSAGRFEVAEDGRRLRIGSTELDLAAATHRFEVDNDKRGVKIRLEIDAEHALAEPVHAGDPETSVVHLGSPTRARVWRRGMAAPRNLHGRSTLVRTSHTACERDLIDMRIDVHRLSASGSSLLVHERGLAHDQRTWLGWRDEAGALYVLRPDRSALEAWHTVATGDRLPRRLHPESAALSGVVTIGASRLAVDPLDGLPRLVRMLYWFGATPRRVWADATMDLVVDPEWDPDRNPDSGFARPAPLPRGPALASFTFLHEPGGPGPTP